MHAASPTYTPVFLRTAVTTLFALLLAHTGAAAGPSADLPQADGHYQAPLQWTMVGEQAAPSEAEAQWTQIGDQVMVFSVRTTDASFVCHGTNGTAHTSNGTSAEWRCGVAETAEHVFFFEDGSADRRWEGRFSGNHTRIATLDIGAGPPSSIPGFVVAFLAFLFFLATLAVGVLYVQERRMSHYLVRRLYEETKGRMPADWPENMRQQWIARVFIRGKN